MIGSAFGAALPTVSDAAVAGPAMIDPMATANAASSRPRHGFLIMVPPHILVRRAWRNGPDGLMRTANS
jgi:hypothetical protein